jgi:hypothetical protein
MSSRRHKSSKNKSRRLGKKGGGFYPMVARTAIRTGSSFGSFGAKMLFPVVLMYAAPTLKPETRKTTEKYFKNFVNASNRFIQHNVTKSGTKKAIEMIKHPEKVAADLFKQASDRASSMKEKYANPEERAKLIASAKEQASSAAASAKNAANQIAETEQFKEVSKVVSDAKNKVTNTAEFKAASSVANTAVNSEQFQTATKVASVAASNASKAAESAYKTALEKQNAIAAHPAGGSKKSIKHKNKRTKKRKVRKSLTHKHK